MRKPLFALVKPLALCFVLLLASCDFLAGPDAPIGQGNVTINMGGEGGNLGKAALPADQFRYELTFTGAGQSFTRTLAAGNGVLNLELALGTWTINARAFTESNELIGEGTKIFTVTSGSNSVKILMAATGIAAYREPSAGNRIYYATLQAAIAASPPPEGADAGETITLIKDISINNGSDMIAIASDQWIKLVSGGAARTISRGSAYAGSLIEVDGDGISPGRLVLGDEEDNTPLIIDGNKLSVTATGPLIQVKGDLTISGANVVLRNNKSSTSGGGVFVDSGAHFTMEAGSIIGNEVVGASGGGVYVDDGTFEMSGGTIGDGSPSNKNSAGASGGGVAVYSSGMLGGIFTMTGTAKIDGNSAVTDGGGVWVSGSNNSVFTMESGFITGNTATGPYGYGGGVRVTDGTFIMKGGTIGGAGALANEAYMGGGVYTQYNFYMEGGLITGNTVRSGGSGDGVYVISAYTAVFSMKGEAVVDPDTNVVYLDGGNTIRITDTFLSGTGFVANIVPSVNGSGTPLLAETISGLISANYDRFKLNGNAPGSPGGITSAGELP